MSATPDPVTELYTTRDVAELFGLQEARLRYWAQTGFVGPSVRRGGRAFYTFADLVGVKVARELLDHGLPLQRVRRNLDALQAALPGIDRPLSRLKVCSDGESIVVLADDGVFEPTTGQLVLSFALGGLGRSAAEVKSLAAARAAGEARTGYETFAQGLRADDAGDHEGAETFYRRAVTLDDRCAAAWTNLGNLLERTGARGEARTAYEKALELDPEQPEARYNLANLLADLGETEAAKETYRRVLALAPGFADASFNLGLLCLTQGDRRAAREHLLRYLELDGDSTWSERARLLLASAEEPKTKPRKRRRGEGASTADPG